MHLGHFVAERKLRDEPERYRALVAAGDAAGILEALTNSPVEARIIERVRRKVATYGSGPDGSEGEGGGAFKVQPDVIAKLYEVRSHGAA